MNQTLCDNSLYITRKIVVDNERGKSKYTIRHDESKSDWFPVDQISESNETSITAIDFHKYTPTYIYIPAVRDVSQEIKTLRSNPISALLGYTMKQTPPREKEKLERKLRAVSDVVHGENRLKSIDWLLQSLNSNLNAFMSDCKLDIKFPVNTFDSIFKNIDINVDDGFEGNIIDKGTGLQRYVIFSMIKAYLDMTSSNTSRTNTTSILLIEEPELYLHPQAQKATYQLLTQFGQQNNQIIYTTHSSSFINIADFDKIAIVQKNRSKGTKITQVPIQAFINDLNYRCPDLLTPPTAMSIRERYSHIYNPHKNEGFFAKKIILVEGQTEEYALPIYCKKSGYDLDEQGISVINVGGIDSMDRFLRVFNEFGIPCYVIFDSDVKELQNEAELKKSQSALLKLLECDQVPQESTFEKRFTMFKNNFETQMRTEIPDYDSYVSSANKDLGRTTSKPLIARYMANKIQKEDIPLSIKKIITKIQNLEWYGTVLRDS